jgi:hypothetical protein
MREITRLSFITLPLLSACVTTTLPDPQIAALARDIGVQSTSLAAALAAASAPECDYEHNKKLYAQLSHSGARLQAHLAASNASKPLTIAADALARTIADASRSHQLASAMIATARASRQPR